METSSANISMNSQISEDALSDARWIITEYTTLDQSLIRALMNDLGTTFNHSKYGKYPKRLARLLKRRHGIQLSSDTLSMIGKVLAESCGDRMFHVVILPDVSFRPGIFGDDDACFFKNSQHHSSHYRRVLQLMNAKAVCFFENGIPIARCWIIPESDDSFLLINLYVDYGQALTLKQAGSIVSDMIGHNHICEIDWSSCNLWVNGDTAIRLSTCDYGMNYSNLEQPDCDYEHDECISCRNCGELLLSDYSGRCPFCNHYVDVPDSVNRCCHCGERVSDDYAHYNDNGDCYCSDCYHDLYFYCECCDSTCSNDEAVWIESEDRSVCRSCFDECYHECSMCGNYEHEKYLKEIEGKNVCWDCYKQLHTHCFECDRIIPNEDVKYVEGLPYCAECKKAIAYCVHCGVALVESKKVTDIDGICIPCYHDEIRSGKHDIKIAC